MNSSFCVGNYNSYYFIRQDAKGGGVSMCINDKVDTDDVQYNFVPTLLLSFESVC